MAVTNEQLLFKITVQNDQAIAALNEMKKELKDMQGSFSKTQKAVDGFGAKFAKLGVAAFAAIAGIQAVGNALQGIVTPFTEAQDAVTKLRQSLELTGVRNVQGTIDTFNALGQSIENFGVASTEQVLNLAKIGFASGQTQKQIEQLITVAADLSVARDIPLESAFKSLLSTLKGSAGELSAFIPELKMLTDEQLKAGKAIEYVSLQVGGFAARNLETYSGQFKVLRERIGDTLEIFGQITAEVFSFDTSISQTTRAIQEFNQFLMDSKDNIVAFGKTIMSYLVDIWELARAKIADYTATFQFLIGSAVVAFGKLQKFFDVFGKRSTSMADSLIAFGDAQLESAGKNKLIYDNWAQGITEVEAVTVKATTSTDEFRKKAEAAKKAIADIKLNAISEEEKKKIEEALAEEEKILKEQMQILDGILKKNTELKIASLGDTLTAREKINESLKVEVAEVDNLISRYSILYGKESLIVQELQKQKQLLGQVAQVQLEMTKRELPDWIAGLGKSIEAIFGRKNIDAFFSYIKENVNDIATSPIVLQVKQQVTRVASGPVGDAAGQVGDAISKGADALFNAGGAISNVLQTAGGWVGALIDVFMNADKYLNILLEFPKSFLKVIQNLPALVQKFVDSFPGMIRAIAEALPGIILKLVDMIPNFIAALLDAVPLLIERLAEALPEILVKLVAMLPKLIAMVGRALFLAVQSLIKGLIRGIGRLFSGVKMPRAEISTKGLESTVKKLQGSSSRLFQVKDLMDAAKDPMLKLTDGVTEAFKKGSNFIKDAWKWVYEKIIQPIFNALKDAWMWVYEKIVMPIAKLITDAWTWVDQKIIQPIIEAFKAVFNFLNDNVFKPVIQGFKAIFNWLNQTIFQPFTRAVSEVFSWVQEKVISPLASAGEMIAKPIVDAFQGIMGLFNGIGDALKNLFKLDFSGVKEAFQGIFDTGGEILKDAFKGVINPIIRLFNGVIDVLNGMVIPGVRWSVSAGKLGSWSGQLWDDIDLIPGDLSKLQTLAAGGLVLPSSGVTLQGLGTDTVPIAATPGEFIVNRRGVETAGLDMLGMINRGIAPQGQGATYNIEFEINIDAKTPMDEGFIRGKLVPAMRDELKRASLDGQFVISQRGIR